MTSFKWRPSSTRVDSSRKSIGMAKRIAVGALLLITLAGCSGEPQPPVLAEATVVAQAQALIQRAAEVMNEAKVRESESRLSICEGGDRSKGVSFVLTTSQLVIEMDPKAAFAQMRKDWESSGWEITGYLYREQKRVGQMSADIDDSGGNVTLISGGKDVLVLIISSSCFIPRQGGSSTP